MNDLAPLAPAGNPVAPLDYALWLASLGIAVFPLNPANKLPYSNREVAAIINTPEPSQNQGGLKFATMDFASIRAWWLNWPGALIGIRTGSVSGVYVLDIDRKNGKDGFTTIITNGWTIPQTVALQTPSGGAHYYFRIPRDGSRRWKTDAGTLGVGVDRKGDDGFAVWYGADLSQPMTEPPAWMIVNGGITTGRPREDRKPLGTECAPDFEVAAKALQAIDPNDLDYHEWRNVTFAFRQAATGLVHDDFVRMAWDSWCAQHLANEKADNEKLWRSADNGTQVGWSHLHWKAYGRPPQPDPMTLFGGAAYLVPSSANVTQTQPARPQQPQQLDGYVEIISTASGDSGKNTLMETVKVLHGNLPVAFDEFTQTVLATHPLPWDKLGSFPRQWTELDTIHCQLSVQALFVKPGKETVHDAVAIIANKHKRHQVREYLNALQWDGVQRLPQLASRYFGTPDTSYASIIMTKFMIGAVARIMHPGSKMGSVIILEGKQGTGKSKAIAAIAGPDWFTDELPDLHTKDAAIQLAGKWIIEVSELSALKRSDVETIKKFMDRSTDRYRAPYEKIAADHLRQCVFVATTNDENYLKDQTGNRRFWPLACGTIDVEAIKRDRDQLWAEALTRYRNGERWWLENDETKLAEIEQEERRETDPWEDRISAHVAALNGLPTTFAQICFVLNIPFERLNSTVNKRVAQCLKRSGYVRRQVRNGEFRSWLYVKE
ncbi:VapE domain-containing protein [Mesorhizobium sp. WSM2561]|uniref:VapE domain-containing protein n=1 Tax=Mesorhizobium sp. WSM2561 TaxID=1040985 RepID=UPI0004B0D6B8|nr:VapE domain-containing protein [Mesorhizobium sp. WSM2561]